ncbi:hypothetical protein P8918_14100 [Bacillus spizizenii]|nr:hypothetical protein [Bacillus spizizenii]MEC0842162.1 hypothetical protein [Bacillus spizizenii]
MNPTDNPIISGVISKLKAQQEKGLAKYGQPVHVNAYDLHGWLQHALEETLDHAVYLEAAIQTLVHTSEKVEISEAQERAICEGIKCYEAQGLKRGERLYNLFVFEHCRVKRGDTKPWEGIFQSLNDMSSIDFRNAIFDGYVVKEGAE